MHQKLQNLSYTIVFVRMTFGPVGYSTDEWYLLTFFLCSFLQNEAAKKKGTKTKEGWFLFIHSLSNILYRERKKKIKEILLLIWHFDIFVHRSRNPSNPFWILKLHLYQRSNWFFYQKSQYASLFLIESKRQILQEQLELWYLISEFINGCWCEQLTYW